MTCESRGEGAVSDWSVGTNLVSIGINWFHHGIKGRRDVSMLRLEKQLSSRCEIGF